MVVKRICQWCGKPFIAQKTTTNYCSHQCSSRGYKHRMKERRMELIHSQELLEVKKRLESQEYFTFSQDSKNILRGYILQKGNARYKASELGVGRNLMASKLYQTWLKEHPESNQPQRMRESKSVTKPSVGYSQYEHGTVPYRLTPMEMNIDSISLKRCLRCLMMNSTTVLSAMPRNLPIWLFLFSSACLQLRM